MTTSLVLMSAILGASIDLFEGDILGFDLYQKNAVLYQSERVWPDGIIPYVVSQQFSKRQRKMINKAMKQYRSRTCIKFIPRASDHSNYINITMTGSGCFSYVGRNGGGQLVSLDDYCFRRIGTIVHELMHVAGFYHEQSRTDRDDYVTIIWDNIQPGIGHWRRLYRYWKTWKSARGKASARSTCLSSMSCTAVTRRIQIFLEEIPKKAQKSSNKLWKSLTNPEISKK